MSGRYASNFDVKYAESRMATYKDNAQTVYWTFKRYGLQTYTDVPGEGLISLCAALHRDVKLRLGADRLPISDYFAVVPNYYISLNNESVQKEWEEYERWLMESEVHDDDPEAPLPPDIKVTYRIGLELVVRDFRNYLYMIGGNGVDAREAGLRHPTGQPLPPVEPSPTARSLDIPIGMIEKVALNPQKTLLTVCARGFCGEHVDIEVGLESKLKPPMPASPHLDQFDWSGRWNPTANYLLGLKDN